MTLRWLAGRPIEAALFLVALITFAVGEFTLAQAGIIASQAVFPALVLLTGLYGATHLFLAWCGVTSDQLLFPAAGILCALSICLMQRLDPGVVNAQFIWVALGFAIAAAIGSSTLELWNLSRFKYTFAVAGFVLLAITAVFGREVNGARLWIGVGPLAFQSTEAIKIVLVIFIAGYLEDKRELLTLTDFRPFGLVKLPPIQYLGPLFVMWAASLLSLLWQRDLGGTLLLLGVALAMLYAGTGKFSYIAFGVGLFVLNVAVTYHFYGYVRSRVDVWLDPWAYASNQGYQIVQALYAVSSGGILGAGLGQGMPLYIPEVHTDFVFAAVAEELGMLGAAAILLVYLIVVFRSLRIALRSPGPFEQFLALGLASLLGLQCIVIVAGNLELIPLTGITLPFVSYGGSSMLVNFVILGLLSRLSALAQWAGV